MPTPFTQDDLFTIYRSTDDAIYRTYAYDVVLWEEAVEADGSHVVQPINADAAIDGGVYAITRQGIVTAVGVDVVGTSYDNGIYVYSTETISGNGEGLTVEIRYSSNIWTPGYAFVVEGGENYEIGDQVRVIGGSNDKILEITGVTQEEVNE